jgi:hypothetical protein
MAGMPHHWLNIQPLHSGKRLKDLLRREKADCLTSQILARRRTFFLVFRIDGGNHIVNGEKGLHHVRIKVFT